MSPASTDTKCSLCGRPRHRTEKRVYHPIQHLSGEPLGWRVDPVGAACPDCLANHYAAF